ncbi:MAG: alpha/beta hydrolase [Oscillospiraceae bacterium]|jgi:fermentation-respiration switch protein FrsA (DUF1100 family)|nr:alpha/beta hydrolase [Oscillospiraceae bacterium]
MFKKSKKTFASLVTVSTVTLAIAYLIGNKFYNLAIDPKSDKAGIFNAPHNFVDKKVFKLDVGSRYEKIIKKDMYAKSFDNFSLHAKIIYSKSKSNNWVIVCHGYGGVGVVVHKVILKFLEMDFNVLIPDLRGFGESDCNYIGWGWHDRIDMFSWIKIILSMNCNANIGFYGISMGAAAVMAASGEDLPPNVKFAIEDSGYSSLWEEFLYQFRLIYKMPTFPFLNLASFVTKIKANYSFKEVDMVKQVSKSKVPILFIHGDKDTFVPTDMIHKVYDATKTIKEKIVIKDARHVEGLITNEDLYWGSIKKFIRPFI